MKGVGGPAEVSITSADNRLNPYERISSESFS